MKKTTILLLAILTFGFSYSQEPNLTKQIEVEFSSGILTYQKNKYYENDTIPIVIYPKDNSLNKPIIVLDNNIVGYETLSSINVNQIDSFDIEKGKFEIDNKEYNGKIIVKTKSNYQPNIINLKEFILKYAGLKNDNYIFNINGEVVNTCAKDIFVDEKNIMQIKIVKLNKIGNSKDLYFITLLNRTPENLKKANAFYIRGSGLSMNKQKTAGNKM